MNIVWILIESFSKSNDLINIYNSCEHANGRFGPGRCSDWLKMNCKSGDSRTEPYLVGVQGIIFPYWCCIHCSYMFLKHSHNLVYMVDLWTSSSSHGGVCWTDGYLCVIMVFFIIFLLIIVNWCFDDFFIINSQLQFLYHVVGTCDDREPSFVGANEQQ